MHREVYTFHSYCATSAYDDIVQEVQNDLDDGRGFRWDEIYAEFESVDA